MSISPDDGFIAFKKGPVAVPGRSAVIRFGSVMEAFAVTTHEEKLEVDILGSFGVERGNKNLKPLPLSQRFAVFRIRDVGLVDQAKVCGGLDSLT